MPDIAALKTGVRLVGSSHDDLIAALKTHRNDVAQIVAERRPQYASGKLSELVDGTWSLHTERTVRRLGALGLQLNSLWAELPPTWECPCCRRSKDKIMHIADPEQRVAIAHAVKHHDHFDNYVNEAFRFDVGRVPVHQARAIDEIKRRLLAGVIAFDPSVICEACNHADAEAKKVLRRRLKLDDGFLRYFSFSPGEIRQFIRPAPNVQHRLNEDSVVAVFDKGRKTEIMQFRKEAVDLQARLVKDGEHWRSLEQPLPDESEVYETYCENSIALARRTRSGRKATCVSNAASQQPCMTQQNC